MPLPWCCGALISIFFVCALAAKRNFGKSDITVHNSRLRSKTLSGLTRELKKQQVGVLDNLAANCPRTCRIESTSIPPTQFVASIYRKGAGSGPWKFLRDIALHHSTLSSTLLSQGNQRQKEAVSELDAIVSRDVYGMQPFGYPLIMEALVEADPAVNQIPYRNIMLGYQLSLPSLPKQSIRPIQRLNPHRTFAGILGKSINELHPQGDQSIVDAIGEYLSSKGITNVAAALTSSGPMRVDHNLKDQLDRRLESVAAEPLPPLRLVELTTDGGCVDVPLSAPHSLQVVGGGAVLRLHFGLSPSTATVDVNSEDKLPLTDAAIASQLSRHALNTGSPRKLHKLKVKALISLQKQMKRAATTGTLNDGLFPAIAVSSNGVHSDEKMLEIAIRLGPCYQLSSHPSSDALTAFEAELSASLLGLTVVRHLVSRFTHHMDSTCRLVIQSDSKTIVNVLRSITPTYPSVFGGQSSPNSFRRHLKEQLSKLWNWFEDRSIALHPRWIPSHPEKRHHSALRWSPDDIAVWKADRLATLSLSSTLEADSLFSSVAQASPELLRTPTYASNNLDDDSSLMSRWEADVSAASTVSLSLNSVLEEIDSLD